MTINVSLAQDAFDDWDAVLVLLQRAFATQDRRIDPPSSVHHLDAKSLAAKAAEEKLLLATEDGTLLGCVFAREQAHALYVGKLAVSPDRQHEGIGRLLMEGAEALARELGIGLLELETRVELLENHRLFAALGYQKTAETAHPGFDRTTSITMRKTLA